MEFQLAMGKFQGISLRVEVGFSCRQMHNSLPNSRDCSQIRSRLLAFNSEVLKVKVAQHMYLHVHSYKVIGRTIEVQTPIHLIASWLVSYPLLRMLHA